MLRRLPEDCARLLTLAAALLLSAGCATTPKPDGPMIDHVEAHGFEQIPPSAVAGKILSTQSSYFPVWLQWLPFVGEDHYFDENAWEADLRRIERYYQAEGYYGAKVVDDEVIETKPGHVELKVTVKEGPPTRIREIAITGLDALAPDHQEEVKKKLPLKIDALFREDDWAETKSLLVSRLRELGYAEALVVGEATVDLELNTASVALQATPGLRYKFGNLFVASDPDAKTPPKWIVEQAENVIRPGDWYSESALDDAQNLIFQMGVFGAVKVNRGAPDRAQGTVPVVVDVREAPFHGVRFGGGLGVDAVRQEAHLLGEYTNRNFLGGLRKFTLKGKAGWAFLPTIWGVVGGSSNSKMGPVATVNTEFEQPRIFGARNLTGQIGFDLFSGLEPAYDYIGGTLKAGIVWKPSPNIRVFPSYNLDVYRLGSQVPLGSNAPEALFGCPLTCIISYLDQTIEWDRRDSKLEPKEGWYLALSLQEGGLGGVFRFFRAMPEARGYVSFGEEKRVTLAAKVKAGTLLSFNPDKESPILARFFSGGSSMRGFSTRRLSPLLEVPRAGSPPPLRDGPELQHVLGETVPIGGKGLLEASVELRWNVWDELVLALFSDSGMVSWEALFENGNQFDYFYTSVGLGIRYRTPLGPIRVDFAVRLPVGKPQRLNPTGRIDPRVIDYDRDGGCLGLGSTPPTYGGHPEGVCAFHLSIGEAF